jgi:hypothetical protein
MSLRVIYRPEQVQRWLTDRSGSPAARRRGTDTDLRVLFDAENGDYEPISIDELIEAMRFHHLVMLVDDDPAETFHKFHQHS